MFTLWKVMWKTNLKQKKDYKLKLSKTLLSIRKPYVGISQRSKAERPKKKSERNKTVEWCIQFVWITPGLTRITAKNYVLWGQMGPIKWFRTFQFGCSVVFQWDWNRFKTVWYAVLKKATHKRARLLTIWFAAESGPRTACTSQPANVSASVSFPAALGCPSLDRRAPAYLETEPLGCLFRLLAAMERKNRLFN